MAKVKKAALLSLGALLLGLALISVSLVLSSLESHSSEASAGIAAFDRAFLLSSSIGRGFREIFEVSSGISIIRDDGHMVFGESLPNTHASAFRGNILAWENFVMQESGVALQASEIRDHLPLVIQPGNITYYHPDYGGNSISIIPQSPGFGGYEVGIISGENVTSCSWSPIAGNFSVIVEVEDSWGIACAGQMAVDPYAQSSLEILTAGGEIVIGVSGGGRLDVSSSHSAAVFAAVLADSLSVELPPGSLLLSFPSFGLSVGSPVTIFE